MSTALLILIFVAVLVLLLLGHPLAFTLGAMAIFFGAFFWGQQGDVFYLFAQSTSRLMNQFVYVCGPLFVFMACLLERSGLAENLFDSLHVAMGGLRGGLGVTVILICTMLAASTGIIGASISIMGMLGLPAMMKSGYDKKLACGTIMAGGCLGTIIPPSIILIIYGAESQLSIAKLYMGGVFSGLLLSALYIVYILIRCYINPQLGPAMPEEDRRGIPTVKKVRMVLVSILPPLGLIVAVLGSLFAGMATPTEAAAVGAIGAAAIAALYQKLTWTVIKESCYSTIKVTAMVFWIILGASMFTSVFLGLGGGAAVKELMLGLGLGRYTILAIMLVILLVLGCFIDCYGILLMCIPIFGPIVKELGFDPIWFGLLFTVMIQMSYLSPPFAYAIFFLRAVSPPEIKTSDLWQAVVPFLGLQAAAVVLCIIFPEIITWLPMQMMGK
jgi:tripartite ATP-independent transporter DctM subunit